MREIKFRAWDGKSAMYYSQHQYNREQDYSPDALSIFFDRFGHMKVMQFTGLKDKNGKEIYEGDIVGIETMTGPEILVVEWKAGYVANFTLLTSGEIIGNIYENPDFLK